MITNMKFGECLHSLLSIFDISIVRLSKFINVDSSLVNRWVNEKRTPSYSTNYIEKISEYFSNCIINSFQEQHIDALYLKVCGDNELETCVNKKIKKILLQSQGYSIEYRKKTLKENKIQLINKKEFSKSMDGTENYSRQNEGIKFNAISINLSNNDKIIIGYKNILAASISLLEDASNHTCNNSIICISFNSDMYVRNYYDIDLICLRNAILKVINNGWNILFLLRLNNNTSSIIKFINFAQPLINTGKFKPYYFKKYDQFAADFESIIVPEIGAILYMSNSLYTGLDTAFYFKNKVAVNIFKNNFNTILSTNAQPLVKYYTQDNAIEYSRYVAEHEDTIGDRILYKDDFSILMLPEKLYIKLLQKKNYNNEEINTSLEFYKRRLKSLTSNILSYKYTDIYHINCFDNLIGHRNLSLYLYNKVEIIDLEVGDVIEILKNIKALLEKYSNFNIALIPKKFFNDIPDSIFYCIIKERNAVMLETYKHLKNTPETRLSIEEPILVNAIEAYFKEILDQIAPINKDKKELTNWIQCQINSLMNKNYY